MCIYIIKSKGNKLDIYIFKYLMLHLYIHTYLYLFIYLQEDN